ncbi:MULTISPECIES: ribonuclease P protein component [Nostocales]|uniref:Ribonuclease P protein component n=3 Tax=Nostocales TaxID=1161 RepID=A0A0C1MZP7_9CYAN|nr:ribonuclease P protein component [Tolypothrix bouteillei]KAF3888688.1 ribonuclease P protein component [Tolypothrix bouteillei VB521301]
MALHKAHRLKSRKDFQAVFREGIRRHSRYFTLRALRSLPSVKPSLDAPPEARQGGQGRQGEQGEHSPLTPSPPHPLTLSPSLPPTQIGISISTKVSKRAVVRNRIKRQIAAAMHQLLPRISPGWRLVVVVKPTAAEQECVTQQFLQELEQLLAQAEVFNGNS